MSPVVYVGYRDDSGTAHVAKHIDELEPVALNLRTDLRLHADAPEWAYQGSGPRQLATALLADVMGDETALELAQRFKREVIARLPREGFEITAEAVEEWAKKIEQEEHGQG